MAFSAHCCSFPSIHTSFGERFCLPLYTKFNLSFFLRPIKEKSICIKLTIFPLNEMFHASQPLFLLAATSTNMKLVEVYSHGLVLLSSEKYSFAPRFTEECE